MSSLIAILAVVTDSLIQVGTNILENISIVTSAIEGIHSNVLNFLSA